MFDLETTAFLESGCALIIGTVGDDGAPHSGRGWGLDVLDDDDAPGEAAVRILLDVDDLVTVAHAANGGALAVTATSVRTLHSIQLKGDAVGVEVATEVDEARSERYCDAFFTDIVETDHMDRALVERLRPIGYVACTASIREVFDQTPGPGAGASVEGSNR